MKYLLLATTLLLSTGCATTNAIATGPVGAAQPLLTFSCSLDWKRCHLIASAAHWAAEDGLHIVQVEPGEPATWSFIPGRAESIWAGMSDSYHMGGEVFAVPAPMPAIECHAGVCEVNLLPSPNVVRDGDFVALVQDRVFGKARVEQ